MGLKQAMEIKIKAAQVSAGRVFCCQVVTSSPVLSLCGPCPDAGAQAVPASSVRTATASRGAS